MGRKTVLGEGATELVKWARSSPRFTFSPAARRCTRLNLMRNHQPVTRGTGPVDLRIAADSQPDGDGNTFCTCTEQGRAAFTATLDRKGSPQKRLSAKILEVIQSQRDGTLGDNLTEGGSTAERFSLTLACNSVQWFTASVAIWAS